MCQLDTVSNTEIYQLIKKNADPRFYKIFYVLVMAFSNKKIFYYFFDICPPFYVRLSGSGSGTRTRMHYGSGSGSAKAKSCGSVSTTLL
jgi:hypothetical protein